MKQAFGIDIPHTLEDVCTPNRLALLVYDMQVGIKSQVKEGDTIVAKTREVLKAARAAKVRVFFHAAHVLAQRANGRISISYGDDVATCRGSRKGGAMVFARYTRLCHCAGAATTSERSHIRQTCYVGI